MRIPSQFNEDNLYRRGRRPDETSQVYRRLMRLVIGLAVVLLIMKKASQPEIYEAFFGAQATPSRSEVSDTAGDVSPALDQAGRSPAEAVTAEDRRIANRLTSQLSPAQQREWVVALSRWQRGAAILNQPSTVEPLKRELASGEDARRRDAWLGMIQSLLAGPPNAAISPAAHRPRIAAFLASLDDAAAARVVDGSVWRSSDFDAFYRYLDQADTLSADDVAFTGVLPLLQQPHVFRHQLVRVQGGVARAELMEAGENPYGIREYWQLWLRPSDGADRPLVVIARDVPPLVAAVGPDAINEEGPRISFVGRYLKRLAYQSSIGADLAPVVIGRILAAPAPRADSAAMAQPTTESHRLWWILAAAAVTGFAVAALAMWRTSVMARRARSLRTAYREEPDAFLTRLKDSIEADQGNGTA